MRAEINNIEWPDALFITGIGTDVGKTYATGWLAKQMMDAGLSVITQKFVQTGNIGKSEDIEKHRQIMEIPLQKVDLERTTAPVIFSYPCSPELAARIDKSRFDLNIPAQATQTLLQNYDHVLIEGAGGLMVPITDDLLATDYIIRNNLPVIVVFNGQLGSINHTLLTLEAIRNNKIKLFGLIYNPFFDRDRIICEDTIEYVRNYCRTHFPDSIYLKMD